PQVGAVYIFHDEVVVPARFAEVVDRDDVRVLQARQRAGFTDKTLGEGRVVAGLVRQDLQGHEAVELDLPRLVDRAHAAVADQPDDFELREMRGEFFHRWRREPAAARRGAWLQGDAQQAARAE